MNRRELIQRTTLALGYTLSGSTLTALLSGCEVKHTISYAPTFFTEEQAIVMGDLAEVILPRTTTPGAKDVGVPAFIDNFVREIYSKEDQEKFKTDLDAFNEGTRGKLFKKFSECLPEEQKRYTEKIHSAAIADAGITSEGWWNTAKVERPFILKMKELTILGFFSSQKGATEVLQYNVAPGAFKGCVPLNEVGKAWAT
jgi:gluconate 2-dehydrogenase gamma chain